MIHSALIRKQRLILYISLLLIIITFVISMGIGASSLTFEQLIQTILGQGSMKEEFILYSIRLPRITITLLAGMALALSGSILQGITRNNLADPGIIGINSGAGVAIAVYFLFFPVDVGAFTYLLPVVAFIGAFITVGLIYIFSYDKHTGLEPTKLVLIGVGFSMALSGLMVVLISSAE